MPGAGSVGHSCPTPSITANVGGLSVAVFGLTVPMITERMLARKVSAYVFDDPIETAAGLVPELRAAHDVVIALTHIGLAEDRRLAEAVPGIDLIVGGHTHTVLETPETVAGVSILQAGWRGRWLGRADIETVGNSLKVTAGMLEL